MYGLDKFKSLKIGKKILIFNLVLFVIPCIVLSFLLFYLVQREAYQELDNSRMVILNQIDENFEDMFNEVVSYSNYFFCNREINKLISKKDYSSAYEALQTEKKIKDYFSNSRTIYSNLEYELELLGNNGYNYSSLDTGEQIINYPILEKLEQEKWYSNFEQSSSYIQYIPVFDSTELSRIDGDNTIHGFRIIKNLNSGRYIGLMDVIIRQETIQSMMTRGIENNRQQVLLTDKEGNVISSTNPSIELNQSLGKKISTELKKGEKGVFQESLNGKKHQIYFTTNLTTGWKILMYDESQQSAWEGNKTLLIVIGIYAIYLLLAMVMSFYNARYMSKPLKKLRQDIHTITEGDLSVRTEIEAMDEFGELSQQFNHMIGKIENLIGQLEQKEEEKRVLEMKALQAQINPHFMYNTLASIRFLIEMDMGEKASQSLLALIGLLKRTYSDYRKQIPIKEEVEAVENYLILMKNRYQDTFSWDISIEEGIEQCMIPRISIQPLVENSIIHGFSGMEKQGTIQILGFKEDHKIIIRISDNGIGGNIEKIKSILAQPGTEHEKEKFSSIGIKNVQERLKLFYGEEYGLFVSDTPEGGVTIEIRIPEQ